MSRGLEDVVASTSSITFIDGARGRLLYRGYDINDLAKNSNYEEVAFLLCTRPTSEARRACGLLGGPLFEENDTGWREVSDSTRSLRDCDTMDALEMAIAALGIYDDPNIPARREGRLHRIEDRHDRRLPAQAQATDSPTSSPSPTWARLRTSSTW